MASALQRILLIGIVLSWLSTSVEAQKFDEQYDLWPTDLRSKGTIIAANSLEDSTELDKQFLRASGGKEKAVIVGLVWHGDEDPDIEALSETFDAKNVSISAIDGDAEQVPAGVAKSLAEASGVILLGNVELESKMRAQLIGLRSSLASVLKRGGVIYVKGSIVDLLSRVEITGGKQLAQVDAGLNLIPDSVIETEFGNDEDVLRLKSVLVAHPRLIGIGLEKNTALIYSGRRVQVHGKGQAKVLMAANERQPFRLQTLAQPQSGRRPKEFLVDLTQWRREAIDRTIAQFPPAVPEKPFVTEGSLVIVGGGGMPKGLMEEFIELAGGPEKARLVYVPCAESDEVSEKQGIVEYWKKLGVEHATFIHTKDRQKANT
ncbi:MAG: cyanophycinase, partial [Pirellulaceae bacterium]